MTKTTNKLKIMGLLLTVVILMASLGILSLTASAADDITVAIDTGESVTLKDTDSDGYYDIGTADELYAFAAAVNGGNNAINGELTANITVNENVLTADGELNGDGSDFRTWTPIGYMNSYEDSMKYVGMFEGNGKTVSGLYFNNDAINDVGLFGYFGSYETSSTVSNVGVVDSYIRGKNYVGGIVGESINGSVTGCYNASTVVANAYVGGIVGIHYSYEQNEVISLCYNTGNITSTGSDTAYVGGLIGYNTRGNISKSYNTGRITGVGEDVGGLAGAIPESVAEYCYNTGEVSGDRWVGGLVGNLNINAVLKNSYNAGAVFGNYLYGGVVGVHYEGTTVENCYYLSGTSSTGINGDDQAGTEVKSADAFASGEVAYLLNGDQTVISFRQTLGVDALPTFNGEVVYGNKSGACNSQSFTYEYSNERDDSGITHSGGNATCTTPDACEDCGADYLNPDNHEYEENNGICCGTYQPAELNSDGAYEISNAGQLLWFAELCNSIDRTEADWVGERGEYNKIYQEYYISYNAVLTSDITLNERLTVNGELTDETEGLCDWIQIGSSVAHEGSPDYDFAVDVYQGTFDGRGHTIRGLYINNPETPRSTMFCVIGEEGVVKNVTFEDTYMFASNSSATIACENYGKIQGCRTYGVIGIGENSCSAGFCVRNYGEIEEGVNFAEVFGASGSYFMGGIVYENYGRIERCANFGAIGRSGNSQKSGIAVSNFGTVSSCYSVSAIKSAYYTAGIVSFNQESGVISNCYYNNTLTDIDAVAYQRGTVENVAGKDARAFISGEVAYLLGEGWGQTLGTDANPVPATESNRVYYGYSCNPSSSGPVYTNSSTVTEAEHYFEESTAHDGSYKCAVCGWLDNNGTGISAPQSYVNAEQTCITVTYNVLGASSFRRNNATITLFGGFIDGEITLDLFSGRVVNTSGERIFYGERNTVGYVGAELSGDSLIFRYAFPPSDENHPAGEEASLYYTIRYYGEDGIPSEVSDSLDMKYVSYGVSTEMTEYGMTLNLSFYSPHGTAVKKSVYNAGSYSVTLLDYYGGETEYTYTVEEPYHIGTSITREDTEDGAVITIERNDGKSVIVAIPEGEEGMTVEGNLRPSVRVLVTESLRFSYKIVDANGDEVEKTISVELQAPPEQKSELERLGYTAVDWNDEGQYALALDKVTKYRDGNVTVYLTNCIFKDNRGMVYFTFTPGGATSHTFSKEDILLVENGTEQALAEDVTVSLGGVLVSEHSFLDADCTVPKTCIYCSHTDGDALGHDMSAASCTDPSSCGRCGHVDGDALGHDMKAADCTTPSTCDRCGHTEGEALGHDMKAADCTNPSTCDRCGHTEGDALGHEMKAADCTTPSTCEECGHTEGEALGHDMKAADCTTPSTCNRCGHTEGEALGHDMKAADCTSPSTCNRCGHTEGDLAPHKYDNACDSTCNTCAEARAPREHTDADGDYTCDECGADLPREGLSGGAIVGIVLGSVSLLGGGGFSLFWFVFRRRRF